jgi:hypothetical protein
MQERSLALLFATLFAMNLSAQVYEPTYEKVLVPLPTNDTPGAFGSIWRTVLAVSNISDTPVDVQGYGGCQTSGEPCRAVPISPQGTIYITSILVSDVPAAFLFVAPGRRNDLSITIRSSDQSRTHLTWGASLPVITRNELFVSRFGIGDIPMTSAFRSTLRIYDFDAATAGRLRVRIYKVTPEGSTSLTPAAADPLLVELTPAFVIPVQGGGAAGHPGYISVPLWLLPALAAAQRVRVVIEPLDATGDYWAMVSSTHNDTQHVTVLTPQ